MPLHIQRGRVEYSDDIDIQDLKHLPEDNKRLQKEARSQERQIEQQQRELEDQRESNRKLQTALAMEQARREGFVHEGFIQGIERAERLLMEGVNLGANIAMEGHALLQNGGNLTIEDANTMPTERHVNPMTGGRANTVSSTSKIR